MKKALITIIIVLIACTFVYFIITKRKLIITGYTLKGDKITATINGKRYSVENYREANNSILNYLYEEIQYRSLQNNDVINIKIESNKIKLLDSTLFLNNSNIFPRIYFAAPYTSSNTRKVSLINDSALLRY